MAVPFSGGCICGAVRYECSAEPIVSGFCHCRDCQRETGSAFATTLFVPLNAVRITGEVKYYDGNGDSGHVVSRGFCPTCGARLFGKPLILPEVIAIRAGSLDDPSWFKPERDIYVRSAQPWDFMNPTLPKFAKMPPTLRILQCMGFSRLTCGSRSIAEDATAELCVIRTSGSHGGNSSRTDLCGGRSQGGPNRD